MTTLGHFHESEIHENLNAGVKNPKQLVNPAESWLFLCTDTEVNQNNHVFSTGLSVLRSLPLFALVGRVHREISQSGNPCAGTHSWLKIWTSGNHNYVRNFRNSDWLSWCETDRHLREFRWKIDSNLLINCVGYALTIGPRLSLLPMATGTQNITVS